jgi:hypothetical protein
MKRLVVAGLLAGMSTAGCGAAGSSTDRPAAATKQSPVSTVVSLPGLTPTPSQAVSAPAEIPRYQATVAAIDGATRGRMRYSWRPGCPVPLEDLRLLTLTYWGFDGAPHTGEMVVHRDVAGSVTRVFGALFDERFPIQRMRLVDAYGGDDDRSMAANNTSGFNCRWATGHAGVWSEHSYGRAIDINPVQNPYISGSGEVAPPAGAALADRSRRAPGMIHAGDATVAAFEAIGWSWGGAWTSIKDYQHFSSSGR